MRKRSIPVNIPSDYEEKFDINVFNRRLDELKDEQKFSYTDIADRIGVTIKTIRLWRNGENKNTAVPYKQIFKIAHLFGVNPQYLYIEDAPRNLEEWSKGILESYNKTLETEYDKQYSKFPYKALTDILKCMGYVCFLEEDTDNNDEVRCVVYDSNTRSETYLDTLLIKKLLSGIESTTLFGMKHNDRPDIPRKE